MDAETILSQLSAPDGFPVAALLAATEQREEMAKRFIAEIEKFLDPAATDRATDTAVLLMFHLLGEWRETAAYPVLVRLLHLPDEEIQIVFGEAITETSHRVIAAVFDGDPQPIYDIIHDPNVDEYVRSAMFDALAILVWEGKINRDAAAAFFRDCFTELQPQSTYFVWYGWQRAIAVLGMEELTPLVKQVFDREYIDVTCADFDDFQYDLNEAITEPGSVFLSSYLQPFGSVIDELSDWNWSDADSAGSKWDELDVDWDASAPKRVGFDPYNKVGRNDPCPCGSGKKFKKCCLQ